MKDIDAILSAIENHTRREILRRLVEGRQYALQLAKDLRVSQQAIIKHLETLERYNIIRKAGTERSEIGPPRKLYEMNRKFTLVIDVASGVFEIREYNLDEVDTDEISLDEEDIGSTLRKIEKEIREIEQRRAQLLKKKELLLRALFSNY